MPRVSELNPIKNIPDTSSGILKADIQNNKLQKFLSSMIYKSTPVYDFVTKIADAEIDNTADGAEDVRLAYKSELCEQEFYRQMCVLLGANNSSEPTGFVALAMHYGIADKDATLMLAPIDLCNDIIFLPGSKIAPLAQHNDHEQAKKQLIQLKKDLEEILYSLSRRLETDCIQKANILYTLLSQFRECWTGIQSAILVTKNDLAQSYDIGTRLALFRLKLLEDFCAQAMVQRVSASNEVPRNTDSDVDRQMNAQHLQIQIIKYAEHVLEFKVAGVSGLANLEDSLSSTISLTEQEQTDLRAFLNQRYVLLDFVEHTCKQIILQIFTLCKDLEVDIDQDGNIAYKSYLMCKEKILTILKQFGILEISSLEIPSRFETHSGPTYDDIASFEVNIIDADPYELKNDKIHVFPISANEYEAQFRIKNADYTCIIPSSVLYKKKTYQEDEELEEGEISYEVDESSVKYYIIQELTQIRLNNLELAVIESLEYAGLCTCVKYNNRIKTSENLDYKLTILPYAQNFACTEVLHLSENDICKSLQDCDYSLQREIITKIPLDFAIYLLAFYASWNINMTTLILESRDDLPQWVFSSLYAVAACHNNELLVSTLLNKRADCFQSIIAQSALPITQGEFLIVASASSLIQNISIPPIENMIGELLIKDNYEKTIEIVIGMLKQDLDNLQLFIQNHLMHALNYAHNNHAHDRANKLLRTLIKEISVSDYNFSIHLASESLSRIITPGLPFIYDETILEYLASDLCNNACKKYIIAGLRNLIPDKTLAKAEYHSTMQRALRILDTAHQQGLIQKTQIDDVLNNSDELYLRIAKSIQNRARTESRINTSSSSSSNPAINPAYSNSRKRKSKQKPDSQTGQPDSSSSKKRHSIG